LLRHKRIRTTEAKAKEASRFAEAIITRAKRAHLAEQGGAVTDVHARRMVARDIHDTSVVRELFTEIAPKVATRPGGYTRVVKLGQRLGDGARIAILELVDYNVDRDETAARSRAKSTISRAERVARSRAKQSQKETPAAAPAAAAPVAEETAQVEEQVTETPAQNEQTEAPAETAAPESTETATGAGEASAENTGDAPAEKDVPAE
jgi:large subunit ribosomal protein L17